MKKALVSEEELKRLITEGQYVDPQKLKLAEDRSLTEKISFSDALIDLDLISDENLGKLIADFTKLPFVSLAKLVISPEILHIIPEIVARKHHIIAFSEDKEGLKLASSEVVNPEILQFITKKTGKKVILYFATLKDIDEAFNLYKKELQKSFNDLLKEQVRIIGEAVEKDAPVTQIVNLLIEYAYNNKSSDIHIEPKKNESLIRFRIDGILHDVLHFPKDLHEQVITRIKVLSKLRTDDHLSAQDGKMQLNLEKEELDIRVSIVPIVLGEKAVLRLLSSRSRQFSLSDLGMSGEDLKRVERSFHRPYGMVLATGPTGSGKTTTIYAIIKLLNTRDKNIATIEDPVEYDIAGINQIQVNPATNLTFAAGLRSILRQDPDTILVGEIRDEETASIAINSAMTGHLVLSTLHTNNAATTLPRFIDMGVEPYLVSSTVNVIIAQRLVRKICEKCKVSYQEPYSEINKYIGGDLLKKYFPKGEEIRLYRGKGCPICHNTGYLGRIGIFEVLEMSPSLTNLISQKASAELINKKAIDEGMISLFEDGISKVRQGITSIDEVLNVTKVSV